MPLISVDTFKPIGAIDTFKPVGSTNQIGNFTGSLGTKLFWDSGITWDSGLFWDSGIPTAPNSTKPSINVNYRPI